MAGRNIDALFRATPVLQLHFHLDDAAAPRAFLLEVGIVAPADRILHGRDPRIERLNFRPAHGVVGEAGETVLAVEHACRHAVLHAELPFETRHRPRIGEHQHAARRHAADHLLDRARVEFELRAQGEQAVHPAMAGVAAREFLEREPRVRHDERPAQAPYRDPGVGGGGSVRREESRLRLENIGCGREPGDREPEGRQRAAGREPGVQGLGHRPEVAPQPACHRAGDTERLPRGRDVEPVQLDERRKRGEEGERPGGVEAALVVLVRDTHAELAADLDAQRVRFDERSSAHALAVQAGQHRGDDHGARVRRHHREHVVEVERVPESPVDERGHLGARGLPGPKDGGRAGFARRLHVAVERLGDLAAGAGQDHRESVGDRLLRFLHRGGGQIGQRGRRHERRDRGRRAGGGVRVVHRMHMGFVRAHGGTDV